MVSKRYFFVLPVPIVSWAWPSAGAKDCPCINGTAKLAQIACPKLPNSSVCLPSDYGSRGCAAYDTALIEVCKTSGTVQDWCKDSWCYIDEARCSRYHHESVVLPGLYYSYATCGDHNRYLPSSTYVIRAKTLRVFYAVDDKFVKFESGQHTGVFADAIKEIGRILDFNMVTTQLSSEALEKSNGSSWWACAQDASLGAIDLCIGDFWEVPARSKMVAFTSPWHVNLFYLVVKKGEESTWQLFGKVFNAFTSWLWLFICLVLLGAGVLLWLFEGDVQEDLRDTRGICQKFALMLYIGLRSYTGHDSYFKARTMAGRVLAISLGFFIVVISSCYTANTAAVLVMRRNVGMVKDIRDLIERGLTLCTEGVLMPALAAQFGNLKMHKMTTWSPVDEFDDLFAQRLCDAVVLSKHTITAMSSKNQHCNKTSVGDVLVTINSAMPVSQQYHASVSHGINLVQVDGIFNKLEARYPPLASVCNDSPKDVGELSLDSWQVSGVFLITGVGAVLAALIFTVSRGRSRFSQIRLNQAQSTNDSGKNSVFVPLQIHDLRNELAAMEERLRRATRLETSLDKTHHYL